MKKISTIIKTIVFYVVYTPLVLLWVATEKGRSLKEIEKLHKKRDIGLANGTWTEEDEWDYQGYLEEIMDTHGEECVKHLM
jgi:hypothetical protein